MRKAVRVRITCVLILFLLCLPAAGAQPQTVRLPDSWCGGGDSIFADSFETGGVFTRQPSLGSGGVWPGSSVRVFNAGTLGQLRYYAYVPAQYAPGRAMPMMLVLHGAAGSHALAKQAAEAVRDAWKQAADQYGFIIVAPVGSGTYGSWQLPYDYYVLGRVLDNANQAWNIELNRVSVWGFSAGGHVVWDMVLNAPTYPGLMPLSTANLASMATSAANSRFACSPNPTASKCASLFAGLPRQLPVDVHIGSADPNYPWALADQQRLLANGWIPGDTLSFNVFAGGHTYWSQHLMQTAAFACRFALQP